MQEARFSRVYAPSLSVLLRDSVNAVIACVAMIPRPLACGSSRLTGRWKQIRKIISLMNRFQTEDAQGHSVASALPGSCSGLADGKFLKQANAPADRCGNRDFQRLTWIRLQMFACGVVLSLNSPAWPAETDSLPSPAPVAPTAEQRAFWAFQPVHKVSPPRVNRAVWVKTPIDFFVLANLERQAIKPAPEATKLELIRRVAFDLTGLPPTTEEIESYLRDKSKRAYERMVNRYLESPRYGERWAQHWLDVVRLPRPKGSSTTATFPGSGTIAIT